METFRLSSVSIGSFVPSCWRSSSLWEAVCLFKLRDRPKRMPGFVRIFGICARCRPIPLTPYETANMSSEQPRRSTEERDNKGVATAVAATSRRQLTEVSGGGQQKNILFRVRRGLGPYTLRTDARVRLEFGGWRADRGFPLSRCVRFES